MADLPKDFFKRDLTHTEWETLERQLAGSPKDALRFAKLAKKFFLGLGLPNPEGPSGPSAGTLSLVAKLTVLLAVLGTVLFLIGKMVHLMLEPNVAPTPLPTVVPALPVKHLAIPTLEPQPKAVAPPTQAVPAQPKPTLTPVPIFQPAPAVVAKPPPPLLSATPTANDSPTGLFNNGYQGQDVHQ